MNYFLNPAEQHTTRVSVLHSHIENNAKKRADFQSNQAGTDVTVRLRRMTGCGGGCLLKNMKIHLLYNVNLFIFIIITWFTI